MPIPTRVRSISGTVIVLALLSWAGGFGGEEPAAPDTAIAAAETPEATGGKGDAYRPLGPNLFPLYQHYERTADGTEVRNVLYLFQRTDKPNGDWSVFLFPLFSAGAETEPAADFLSLFPLLFFHKGGEEGSYTSVVPLLFFQGSSPERSYTYSIPFYFENETSNSLFRFLVPFWLQTESKGLSRNHILPPLFRYSQDRSAPELPLDKSRFGLPFILELWESRVEPGRSGYTALNLFNFKEETESGLPLFGSWWEGEGKDREGSTHLFPFFWYIHKGSADFHALFPLYAYSSDAGDSDLWLPPLLSRIGSGFEGERRLALLFPLFSYDGDKKGHSVYSFPFLHYAVNRDENLWAALFILYHTTIAESTGKRTHSVLYPLSYFSNEPDGSGGVNWAFPYVNWYNEERLWRLVLPYYWEYQTLSGGETDWFFRLALPYLSWGYTDDYFATVFPLYWGFHSDKRGWEMCLPLYYHIYSPTEQDVHIPPLFSYRSTPSRTQLFFGGPLYVYEELYGREGEHTGTSHHLLWPFVSVQNREDGYTYRFLPLFSTSVEGDTRGLLLTPFFYQQSSPRGKHRYFIPIYGRYTDDRITHDYYAFGTYVHTREVDEAQLPVRTKHDVLWSLASWEDEPRSGRSHSHVLPVGYWRTTTPALDRTVVGPFYYGHSVTKDRETEHLNLFLGNLLYSQVIERKVDTPRGSLTTLGATEDVRTAAGPPLSVGATNPLGSGTDAATAPSSTELYPLAADAARAEPRREEVWRDEGILWPLIRSYQSSKGERGTWVVPFYFRSRDEVSQNLALFPLYYGQDETGPYNLNYFRYFFLFSREAWRGGYRWSLGQILLDWKAEEATASYRLRLLYPLLEHSWDPEGYKFQFTPLCQFSSKGETLESRIFPFYWQGRTTREMPSGEKRLDSSHFFLFPFYGHVVRSTHRDTYALFPIFHLRTSIDATRFELWPTFFWRDEPALFAVRVWPFHADESRVNAGDFWVSRFLFLSKRFDTADGFEYRLDPFLFRVSQNTDSFGIAGLFELFAYDREGASTDFRAVPFVFGGSDGESSTLAVIPLHYNRDHGNSQIRYGDVWRYVFLSHHLEGANGEHHTGVLWKLFERTANPNRPEYGELGLLYRIFFYRTTENSSNFQLNPLFSYYRNDEDDETQYSFLLSLYSQTTLRGRTTRTLFYFIDF